MTVRGMPATDTRVTIDQQRAICFFLRLYSKRNELREELVAARKQLDTLEDASLEAMVADKVYLALGDGFTDCSGDMDERVEAQRFQQQTECERLKTELASFEQRVIDLRTQLYADFGDRIYLGDD